MSLRGSSPTLPDNKQVGVVEIAFSSGTSLVCWFSIERVLEFRDILLLRLCLLSSSLPFNTPAATKMADNKVYRASTTAPVNIAVVKYLSRV